MIRILFLGVIIFLISQIVDIPRLINSLLNNEPSERAITLSDLNFEEPLRLIESAEKQRLAPPKIEPGRLQAYEFMDIVMGKDDSWNSENILCLDYMKHRKCAAIYYFDQFYGGSFGMVSPIDNIYVVFLVNRSIWKGNRLCLASPEYVEQAYVAKDNGKRVYFSQLENIHQYLKYSDQTAVNINTYLHSRMHGEDQCYEYSIERGESSTVLLQYEYAGDAVGLIEPRRWTVLPRGEYADLY